MAANLILAILKTYTVLDPRKMQRLRRQSEMVDTSLHYLYPLWEHQILIIFTQKSSITRTTTTKKIR